MKVNRSKIIKNVLLASPFLMTISGIANTKVRLPFKQDEGPEQPPGVSVDTYIMVLFITAIIVAGVYFFRKNSEKVVNQ